MGNFLIDQAVLFGYGTVPFTASIIGDKLPFPIRQWLGWSALSLWAIFLLSFLVPQLNSLTLFLINNGVEALWELTG